MVRGEQDKKFPSGQPLLCVAGMKLRGGDRVLNWEKHRQPGRNQETTVIEGRNGSVCGGEGSDDSLRKNKII